MHDPARISVVVVFAEPECTFRAQFELPAGSTVADAIAESGIRDARPDVDINPERVGVFARKATLDTVLRGGDRVEIYRPLRVDPKEARRRRAQRVGRPNHR